MKVSWAAVAGFERNLVVFGSMQNAAPWECVLSYVTSPETPAVFLDNETGARSTTPHPLLRSAAAKTVHQPPNDQIKQ